MNGCESAKIDMTQKMMTHSGGVRKYGIGYVEVVAAPVRQTLKQTPVLITANF